MTAVPILRNVLLKDLAYYATGGAADVVYAPASVEELAKVVREVRAKRQSLMLIGGGTNSLVMDEHFPGAVVLFKGLNKLERRGNGFVVGAGVENSTFAKAALAAGLTGAGWMNGLPGQLGGTVRMNARCYGGEISQIVSKVTTVTQDGQVRSHTDKKMFKGYKDTIFMTNGDLVAEVEIDLAPGDAKVVAAKMAACESDRKSKGQFDYPSCGCVFKNDYSVGVSSGILLDQSGVKLLKKGGAEVSPFHANFVYNKGASSRDILELSLAMRERVYATFGAWLEYEMEILGVVPADLAAKIAEKRPNRLDDQQLAPLRARMAN